MAPKAVKRRAPSNSAPCQGAEAAKALRLSEGLSQHTQREAEAKHAADLEWVMEQLREDPALLQRVIAVMRLPKGPQYDAQTSLQPDLRYRPLGRLPGRVLQETIFPQVFGPAWEHLVEASKGRKEMLRLLEYACLLDQTYTLHSLELRELCQDFRERMEMARVPMCTLVEGRIAWETSGIFRLLPPVPPGADPEKHVFERVSFLGGSQVTVLADADLVVRGTWTIDHNWNMGEAALVNPAKRKVLCFKVGTLFCTAGTFIEGHRWLPPCRKAPLVAAPCQQPSRKPAVALCGAPEDLAAVVQPQGQGPGEAQSASSQPHLDQVSGGTEKGGLPQVQEEDQGKAAAKVQEPRAPKPPPAAPPRQDEAALLQEILAQEGKQPGAVPGKADGAPCQEDEGEGEGLGQEEEAKGKGVAEAEAQEEEGEEEEEEGE